ncbi:MAG: helix-turn-helix domain-containing protein [Myxococcota bacterium]
MTVEQESSVLEQIVDVQEAAEALGITKAAVIYAIQRDKLAAKKVGRSYAVLRSSVESYTVEQIRVAAGKARGGVSR